MGESYHIQYPRRRAFVWDSLRISFCCGWDGLENWFDGGHQHKWMRCHFCLHQKPIHLHTHWRSWVAILHVWRKTKERKMKSWFTWICKCLFMPDKEKKTSRVTHWSSSVVYSTHPHITCYCFPSLQRKQEMSCHGDSALRSSLSSSPPQAEGCRDSSKANPQVTSIQSHSEHLHVLFSLLLLLSALILFLAFDQTQARLLWYTGKCSRAARERGISSGS